jgi:hypothetical protein
MTISDDLDFEAPRFEEDGEPPTTADTGVASEAEARAIIERLLPDPDERSLFLAVLADSILAAHAAGPNKWGLTLYHNRIWLNVGRIVVCGISRGTSWVAIDTRALPDRERFEREELIFNSWKSLPHSAAIRFTPATDPTILQSSKAAHYTVIQ